MAKMGRRTPLIVASFLGGFLGVVLIASVWMGAERATEVFSEPMARLQVRFPGPQTAAGLVFGWRFPCAETAGVKRCAPSAPG
jgi:hypothetical protein